MWGTDYPHPEGTWPRPKNGSGGTSAASRSRTPASCSARRRRVATTSTWTRCGWSRNGRADAGGPRAGPGAPHRSRGGADGALVEEGVQGPGAGDSSHAVNPGHMEYCASDEWRRSVRETILPVALPGVDIGDAAIEIERPVHDRILRTKTAHLTAVEFDAGLAAGLAERIGGRNVVVVLGDAAALDFPDGRFTGAASFHMLHHIAPAEPKTGSSRSVPGARPRRSPRGGRRRLQRGKRGVPRGRHLQPDRPRRVRATLGAAGSDRSGGAPTTSGGCARPAPADARTGDDRGPGLIPGHDHLARLPMIVTTPDPWAIGPVGPTTNNTVTTPR